MQPAETRLSVQSPPVNLISAQNINKSIYICRDVTIIVSLVNAALKLDKPAFFDMINDALQHCNRKERLVRPVLTLFLTSREPE